MAHRSVSVGLLLLTGSWLPLPLRAADSATVQEILDGKEVFINQKMAVVRQKATAPELVSTKNSRAQLAFSGGAGARLNRFSLLRLGASCFLLEKGQVLVSGPQNGCTSSARLSVRGTNYVIDVQEDGSAELSVLEGSVEVEPTRDGEPTGAPSTTVEAGQKAQLSAEGVIVPLLKLSAGDYTSILGGPLFTGFSSSMPGLAALESYLNLSVPGVSLPALPAAPSVPSIPSIPRFSFF